MPGVSPVTTVYAVWLAPTVAICVKLTPSVDRSILKPCSFVERSVQARLIRSLPPAVAVRFVGAVGTVLVLAVMTLE